MASKAKDVEVVAYINPGQGSDEVDAAELRWTKDGEEWEEDDFLKFFVESHGSALIGQNLFDSTLETFSERRRFYDGVRDAVNAYFREELGCSTDGWVRLTMLIGRKSKEEEVIKL